MTDEEYQERQEQIHQRYRDEAKRILAEGARRAVNRKEYDKALEFLRVADPDKQDYDIQASVLIVNNLMSQAVRSIRPAADPVIDTAYMVATGGLVDSIKNNFMKPFIKWYRCEK
jgi:hypothetical protein